jgi:hypothetical protein
VTLRHFFSFFFFFFLLFILQQIENHILYKITSLSHKKTNKKKKKKEKKKKKKQKNVDQDKETRQKEGRGDEGGRPLPMGAADAADNVARRRTGRVSPDHPHASHAHGN